MRPDLTIEEMLTELEQSRIGWDPENREAIRWKLLSQLLRELFLGVGMDLDYRPPNPQSEPVKIDFTRGLRWGKSD